MLKFHAEIDARLRLFFLITFSVVFLLALSSLFVFLSVTTTQMKFLENNVGIMIHSQESNVLFESAVSKSRQFILKRGAKELDEYKAMQNKFLDSLEFIKQHALYPELMSRVRAGFAMMDRMIALRQDGLSSKDASAFFFENMGQLNINTRESIHSILSNEFDQLKSSEISAKKVREHGFLFLMGSAIILLLSGPILYLFLCRTLHKKRQVDEALVKEKMKLERSNVELEQFASVAAHDLRSPISSIHKWVEMLDDLIAKPRNPEIDEAIEIIKRNTRREIFLIRDLLGIARVNVSESSMERVTLDEIISNILLVLKQEIKDTGANIIVAPLPTVIGCSSQLESLFSNFLRNALTYRDKTRRLEISIECCHTADFYKFSIKDNGIGIDAKYTDLIFQMFKRLHSTKDYPGTGIGLAYCKKVVELYGGKIWFTSVLGQGSTFYFTYPSEHGKKG